jgi:hypothetical protein
LDAALAHQHPIVTSGPPPSLGCFGFLILGALLSWPLYKLGVNEDAAVIAGIVMAGVVVAGLQFGHGWSTERARGELGRCPRCSQTIRRDAAMCPFCHLPFADNAS